MVKSKINFDSFLMIYFVTFMLSIVFPAIIFVSIKNILNEFNFFQFCKILLLINCLVLIWFLFIRIHTKIIITETEIVFKKFFGTKKINFQELDFFFETIEPAKFKNYKKLCLVKENKIVARISSFDYKNYNELKENIKVLEKQNFNSKR